MLLSSASCISSSGYWHYNPPTHPTWRSHSPLFTNLKLAKSFCFFLFLCSQLTPSSPLPWNTETFVLIPSASYFFPIVLQYIPSYFSLIQLLAPLFLHSLMALYKQWELSMTWLLSICLSSSSLFPFSNLQPVYIHYFLFPILPAHILFSFPKNGSAPPPHLPPSETLPFSW